MLFLIIFAMRIISVSLTVIHPHPHPHDPPLHLPHHHPGVWGLCHPQSVQGVSHFQILTPFPGLLPHDLTPFYTN